MRRTGITTRSGAVAQHDPSTQNGRLRIGEHGGHESKQIRLDGLMRLYMQNRPIPSRPWAGDVPKRQRCGRPRSDLPDWERRL